MDISPKKLAAAHARSALVTMLPSLGKAIDAKTRKKARRKARRASAVAQDGPKSFRWTKTDLKAE